MKEHTEYEALISAFIDGALPEEKRAELMDHMAQCPDCQACFDDQIAIHAALHEMEETEVPMEFTEKVMEKVRAENKSEKKIINFPRWRQFAALAACCAIAVIGIATLSGPENVVSKARTSDAALFAMDDAAPAEAEAAADMGDAAPAETAPAAEPQLMEEPAVATAQAEDAADEERSLDHTAVVRTHSEIAKRWVEETLGQTWEAGKSYELTQAQYEDLLQLLGDAEMDSNEIVALHSIPVDKEIKWYLLEAE